MPTQIMNTMAFTKQEKAALALAQDDPEQVPCVDQFSEYTTLTIAQGYLKNGPVPALKMQVPADGNLPEANRYYGLSTTVNAPTALATWMKGGHDHPLRSFASSSKWYMPMGLWTHGDYLYAIIAGDSVLNFQSLGVTGAYLTIHDNPRLHDLVESARGLDVPASVWAHGPFWKTVQNDHIESTDYHPDNQDACTQLIDRLRSYINDHHRIAP